VARENHRSSFMNTCVSFIRNIYAKKPSAEWIKDQSLLIKAG
jgi:hypothetical protein